jgi:hypothetical protein
VGHRPLYRVDQQVITSALGVRAPAQHWLIDLTWLTITGSGQSRLADLRFIVCASCALTLWRRGLRRGWSADALVAERAALRLTRRQSLSSQGPLQADATEVIGGARGSLRDRLSGVRCTSRMPGPAWRDP